MLKGTSNTRHNKVLLVAIHGVRALSTVPWDCDGSIAVLGCKVLVLEFVKTEAPKDSSQGDGP